MAKQNEVLIDVQNTNYKLVQEREEMEKLNTDYRQQMNK